MTLSQAQKICTELDAIRLRKANNVKWTELYTNESEIIADLKKVYIPKNRTAPAYTFRGYEYIYSFAYYVNKGWTLSANQMKQCKRLALEIKKAAAIGEYKF